MNNKKVEGEPGGREQSKWMRERTREVIQDKQVKYHIFSLLLDQDFREREEDRRKMYVSGMKAECDLWRKEGD